MDIRKEEPRDYDSIYAVVKAAFDSAEHADGNEQDLVVALRKGENYIHELSLVAEENGKVIGHIMFTKARVGQTIVLALAPLAVSPEYQGNGIGMALITEGHKIARDLGYSYSVVLGSEKYYPKTGYVPADFFGIFAPFKVSRKKFMAYKINENAPDVRGTMIYAKEFGIE